MDQATINAVWAKGNIDERYHPNEYRYDVHGKWMRYVDYGNRNSDFGWEIDHMFPLSKGGSNHISNLQPLNYLSNVRKSDSLYRFI